MHDADDPSGAVAGATKGTGAPVADRDPRRFVAALCHDVRTPVNGILGALELLLEHELVPEVRELAQSAYDATGELHEMFECRIASIVDEGRLGE